MDLNWPQIVGGLQCVVKRGKFAACKSSQSSLYLVYISWSKKTTQQTWLISMAYHRQKYRVHWHITYLFEVIHIATNLNVPGKKNAVFCHFFQEANRTEGAFWMNSHLLCPGFIINKKQLVSLLCFFLTLCLIIVVSAQWSLGFWHMIWANSNSLPNDISRGFRTKITFCSWCKSRQFDLGQILIYLSERLENAGNSNSQHNL